MNYNITTLKDRQKRKHLEAQFSNVKKIVLKYSIILLNINIEVDLYETRKAKKNSTAIILEQLESHCSAHISAKWHVLVGNAICHNLSIKKLVRVQAMTSTDQFSLAA